MTGPPGSADRSGNAGSPRFPPKGEAVGSHEGPLEPKLSGGSADRNVDGGTNGGGGVIGTHGVWANIADRGSFNGSTTGCAGGAGNPAFAPKGVRHSEALLDVQLLGGGTGGNVGDSPNRFGDGIIDPHGVWANIVDRGSFHGSSAGRVSESRSPPAAPEGVAVRSQ